MNYKSFLILLEESFSKNQENVALKFKNEEITYKELNKRSNSIANYLSKKLGNDEPIIAIAMKKSIEQIACIIGILKSGRTYLPIDLSYPKDRIKYIVTNSNVKYVITSSKLKNDINEIDNNLKMITYENIEISNKMCRCKEPKYAYAMYTSGSTGRPKGNLIKTESASNLINWQIEQSAKNQLDECNTLQLAPISFDVSFQEIFSTLCIGGKLVIIDELTRIDFNKILDVIKKENISRVFMPPVYLNEIANIGQKIENSKLKEIIVAGEQLKITNKIKDFFRQNSKCKLINQYGPTETHVVTSYTLSENVDDWETLPVIRKRN